MTLTRTDMVERWLVDCQMGPLIESYEDDNDE